MNHSTIVGISAQHDAPCVKRRSLGAKRLRRVMTFIDARLANNISLKDLAAQACLSPFHFSRLFFGATGTSPHRYLTWRRIEVAQTMIMSGDSSLVQIAFEAGFGSQGNFTRVFRRITGMTPGQYRETYRCARDQQEMNKRSQDLYRSIEPSTLG